MSCANASPASKLGDGLDRQLVVRRGLIALLVAWLAWFYWFSRAAMLAVATLAAALLLYYSLRLSIRSVRAAAMVYRAFCLRALLMLARRIA